MSTSANVAGALGPIVATSLALKYHWTYGFMIPGCICMSVGYLAILVIRNRPSEVGLADFDNSDEINDSNDQSDSEYSNSDNENEEVRKVKLSRWNKIKLMFSYPFFVSICLSYFLVQLIKTLYSDWAQMYLIKSVKIDSYTGKLDII